MRAGVYQGPSSITIEEIELPAAGDDEFVLDLAACAICGSDLHYYTQAWVPQGTIMGHEYSGTVSATGAAVTKVAVGDRLAIIGFVPCGECTDCRAGRVNLCDAPRGAAGGYAEQVVLPEDCVHFAVPDDVSMVRAAFLEPLSVAVRAVNRAAVNPDEPVTIVGMGSIGQSVAQVLAAHGVQTIIAIDLSEDRLALARRLGVTHTINPADQDPVAAAQALIGESSHRGYSFTEATTVFECSGSTRVLDQAVTGLVRKNGTIVMVALFEEPVSFDANPLVRKEVTIVGAYAYAEADWTEAFELIRSGAVDVEALVSHTYPLDEIQQAFATQLDKSASMKVVVIPRATE